MRGASLSLQAVPEGNDGNARRRSMRRISAQPKDAQGDNDTVTTTLHPEFAMCVEEPSPRAASVEKVDVAEAEQDEEEDDIDRDAEESRSIMRALREALHRSEKEHEDKRKQDEEAATLAQHNNMKQRFAQAGSKLMSMQHVRQPSTAEHGSASLGGGGLAVPGMGHVMSVSHSRAPSAMAVTDFNFRSPSTAETNANMEKEMKGLRSELEVQKRLLFKRTAELKVSLRREEATRMKLLEKVEAAQQQAAGVMASGTGMPGVTEEHTFQEDEYFVTLVENLDEAKAEIHAMSKQLSAARARINHYREVACDCAAAVRGCANAFRELQQQCVGELNEALVTLQRGMREALFEVLDFTPSGNVSSLDVWGMRLLCNNMMSDIQSMTCALDMSTRDTPFLDKSRSDVTATPPKQPLCPFQQDDRSAYLQCYVSCVTDMQKTVDEHLPGLRVSVASAVHERRALDEKVRELAAQVKGLQNGEDDGDSAVELEPVPEPRSAPEVVQRKRSSRSNRIAESAAREPEEVRCIPSASVSTASQSSVRPPTRNDSLPTASRPDHSAALAAAHATIAALRKELDAQEAAPNPLPLGVSNVLLNPTEPVADIAPPPSVFSEPPSRPSVPHLGEENFYVAMSNMMRSAKKMKLPAAKYDKLKAITDEAMALSSESAKATWRILCERLSRAKTAYRISAVPPAPPPPPPAPAQPQPDHRADTPPTPSASDHPPSASTAPPEVGAPQQQQAPAHAPPPEATPEQAELPAAPQQQAPAAACGGEGEGDTALNSAAIRDHIVFCWRCGDGPYGPPHRICENCEKRLYYGVYGTIAFSARTAALWKTDVLSWMESHRVLSEKKRQLIRRASLILGGPEARTLCERYVTRQMDNRNRHQKLFEHLGDANTAPLLETRALGGHPSSPSRAQATAATLQDSVPAVETVSCRPKCRKVSATPAVLESERQHRANAAVLEALRRARKREGIVLPSPCPEAGPAAADYDMVAACDLAVHPSQSPYIPTLTRGNLARHEAATTGGADPAPTPAPAPAAGAKQSPALRRDPGAPRQMTPSRPSLRVDVACVGLRPTTSQGCTPLAANEPEVQQPPVAPDPGTCATPPLGAAAPQGRGAGKPARVRHQPAGKLKKLQEPAPRPAEGVGVGSEGAPLALGQPPSPPAAAPTTYVDRHGVVKQWHSIPGHAVAHDAYLVGYQRAAEVFGACGVTAEQQHQQQQQPPGEGVLHIEGACAVPPAQRPPTEGGAPRRSPQPVAVPSPKPCVEGEEGVGVPEGRGGGGGDIKAAFLPLQQQGLLRHQYASWTPGSPCPIAALRDFYVSEAAATVNPQKRPAKARPMSARTRTCSYVVPNLSPQPATLAFGRDSPLALEWGAYKALVQSR